ncbi:MAG: endonuclease/exonuclease/phosphatase family protein [Myxococcales bacterium]|nr:endonuclease/exonuclease/phosphatase family protein [Myxococcales bacterium]
MTTGLYLKVLSYNVKMLPGIFGRGDDDLSRADRIATQLLARDDDVVALQEVFDETVRARLVARLGAAFPHRIDKSGDGLFDEDSGLMLLSRHAFAGEPLFFEWDQSGPLWTSDRWADKGVQLARLQLPGDFELVVGNVHLQADYEPRKYAHVRAAQIEQLAGPVGRTLAPTRRPHSVAALVVGDFNVDGGSDEHRAMLSTLRGARDLWACAHPDDPGYTVDPEVNTMAERSDPRQRLDLAIAFDALAAERLGGSPPLARLEARQLQVLRLAEEGRSLSDHDALAVHVEIGEPPAV